MGQDSTDDFPHKTALLKKIDFGYILVYLSRPVKGYLNLTEKQNHAGSGVVYNHFFG